MLSGLSVRKTAQICGINKNTAFVWRHKILDALQNMANAVHLEGIIEADETFFDISYKGNHSKSKSFTMPRKAHKRGGSSQKRGLSNDKVCVPCAVNRDGLSIAKISNLARIKIKGLSSIFGGRVEKNSTFITDKASAYQAFTKSQNIELVQLKAGKASCKGIYNLQHINSFHSRLKKFLKSFNGVSTKYLNNYLIWNNYVNYSTSEYAEKKKEFLSYVLCTSFYEKWNDLPRRSSLPIVA